MVDNDIFIKTFDPVWRKAYRCAMGDGTPEEVARLCAPALGEFLFKHGCPRFDAFTSLVQSTCLSGEQAHLPLNGNYAEIPSQAAEVARSCFGTVAGTTAQIEANVCAVMALEAQVCGPLHGDVSQLFAQRLCIAMTLAYFANRLNCPAILARFETAAHGNVKQGMNLFFDWSHELEQQIKNELQKPQSVAFKLAADPSCKKVRVPKVRSPKRSAAELSRLVLA
jgi:hypothetical protein